MTERDGRHIVRAHSVNLASDRPVRSKAPGRVCGDEGCLTVLSIYNLGQFCALHAPPVVLGGGPGVGRPRKAVA